MDINESVSQIIDLVGGPDNISSVSHCFTRLRFHLKDRAKVSDEAVKAVPGVLGLIDAGGQVQVIIGKDVEKFYNAALELFPSLVAGGEVEMKPEDNPGKKKMSPVDYIVELASAIFVPCVSLLAGCGTLQGIVALLSTLGVLSADSSTYTILNLIGNSILYYLPVLVAYNTAKFFGGKPFFSMLAVLILIHPTFLNAAADGTPMDFLGIPLTVIDYSSQVFPAIITAWFCSLVEKPVRKIVPDVVKVIFVPLLTLVITVPVALLIIGPVMTAAMNAVTAALFAIMEFSPVLTGIVAGAIWQPLVLLGISKAFVPVFVTNLTTYGYDGAMPVVFIVCALATGGSCLAYGLRSKKPETRQVGIAAFISSLFDITEPGMFSILLPAKKPFIIVIVSSAIGGLVTSLFGARCHTAAMGLLGIPSVIGENGIDLSFWGTILGTIVAFALAFAATWFFGYDEENDKGQEESV